MAKLILENITKRFGTTTAVDDISLRAKVGEFIALLGPSGCGKTTLLRLIAGFETPDSGRIALGGQSLADPAVGIAIPPEDRNLGMVFQSYALWPHMSVARNIAYPLEVRRIAKQEREARLQAALQVTGLTQMANRKPAELSGGQRQRVALARCLVMEPQAVLFDEPLANLDVHLRATMQSAFRDLHRQTGATMVYVTHDQAEAMALADRIAVMQDGRIRQFAPPEILHDEPANAMVAGFVGQGVVLPVHAAGPCRDGWMDVSLGEHIARVRSGTPRPTHLSLRPDGVHIDHNGTLPAQVTNAVYLGGKFRLTLQLAPNHGGGTILAEQRQRYDIGDTVMLNIQDGWAFEDRTAVAV
ncbi:iron(III) transport system ATP-binding protein [Monaibacterium marinum]|uniref:Iron(III) transport system ATP-binding protein n=1 Tax=Pontivivens marinum TaxID=1690039 RepID=A0A2C9CVI4_9RHOB|nr:ABC transporter ATP-binding protein [Monaibacterium marinum]SOH94409.1 iron(III) transport system ATP-binding protein [Monaibacterium marinum]